MHKSNLLAIPVNGFGPVARTRSSKVYLYGLSIIGLSENIMSAFFSFFTLFDCLSEIMESNDVRVPKTSGPNDSFVNGQKSNIKCLHSSKVHKIS